MQRLRPEELQLERLRKSARRAGYGLIILTVIAIASILICYFLPFQQSESFDVSGFTVSIGDYKFSEPFSGVPHTSVKFEWSSNMNLMMGVTSKAEMERYRTYGGTLSLLAGDRGTKGSFEFVPEENREYVWVGRTEPGLGYGTISGKITITVYLLRFFIFNVPLIPYFFLFIGIILIIWMIVAKTMAYYYGQKLLPKPSTTTILYEYCTNCGKKIESSWNICGYCGKRLRG